MFFNQKITRGLFSLFSVFFVLMLLHLAALPARAAIPASFCETVTEISRDECQTLVDFYNHTNGDKWVRKPGYFHRKDDKSRWGQTNTPCRWRGVECSKDEKEGEGKKEEMEREKKAPAGIHSSDLGFRFIKAAFRPVLDTSAAGARRLRTVEGLGLSLYYKINSAIPDLSGLRSLKRLVLSDCKVRSGVPEASLLPRELEELNLSHNQLSGSVPDLSALNKLRILKLDFNKFSAFPKHIVRIASLQLLSLKRNGLQGELPDLGALTELLNLDLSNNRLRGPLSKGHCGRNVRAARRPPNNETFSYTKEKQQGNQRGK
ncbi:MAG: leucine-rich repeat domain-containing protein [Gammaproteobacteria bacterium]|nr:leucine-rich repeat domain-containing protein [Gammaproteobacteria bacterium]